MCPWIQEGDNFTLPNGHQHTLKQHITCASMGIIYLMTCVAVFSTFGKTKRPFSKRIGDHLGDIQGGAVNRPVYRQLGLWHRFDPVIGFVLYQCNCSCISAKG